MAMLIAWNSVTKILSRHNLVFVVVKPLTWIPMVITYWIATMDAPLIH